MAEKRFNPLDPFGLFESREVNPLDPLGVLASIESQRKPSPEPTSKRQVDINRFMADIRKNIPDEAQASEEYTRLANEAQRLGFAQQSKTLLSMAQDESRHKRNLQDITTTTW